MLKASRANVDKTQTLSDVISLQIISKSSNNISNHRKIIINRKTLKRLYADDPLTASN